MATPRLVPPRSAFTAAAATTTAKTASGEIVELRHLPAGVLRRIDQWIETLVHGDASREGNGGFGELWIEVADGAVKRIKPTESWLANKL